MDKIAEIIAVSFDMPSNYAFIAIILLFLNGAANVFSPLSMTIEILGPDKRLRTIMKKDLIYAYESVTKNTYLRRLAESMAYV
jgi:hypothetical protein